MPELDPDLVTLLTLGLLGLIVICLLGVMSSIGRVRKAIERAAARREREREDRWQPATTAATAAAAEPEPAIERRPESIGTAREPEQAETQGTSAHEPASSTSSETTNGPGVVATQGTSSAPEADEAYAASHSESPADSTAASPGAQSMASTTSSSTTTQTTDEPQEQPFERDGRWWFRRGDELLVYDEGTGQWMAAPEDRRPAQAETQPIPTTISNVAGSVGSESSASSEQHGFWKCPSCGAVNGSTATSCRMCFTARP